MVRGAWLYLNRRKVNLQRDEPCPCVLEAPCHWNELCAAISWQPALGERPSDGIFLHRQPVDLDGVRLLQRLRHGERVGTYRRRIEQREERAQLLLQRRQYSGSRIWHGRRGCAVQKRGCGVRGMRAICLCLETPSLAKGCYAGGWGGVDLWSAHAWSFCAVETLSSVTPRQYRYARENPASVSRGRRRHRHALEQSLHRTVPPLSFS